VSTDGPLPGEPRLEPMEEVTEYLRKARSVNADTFQQLYPHYFLYKHAKAVRDPGISEPDIDFATRTLSLNFDPLPQQNQLVPVKKNPDNPFPDRLTIGRATNCDVVIRLAFVSKVHAHLLIQGDKLTLRDNRASNFTFHNHRRLEPGSSRSVKLGDILSFGAIDLELVTAGRLYEILRSNARPMSAAVPTGRR
jgi:pSer/pThr/pTyr-binding forkhead associated (FHA) protein